MSSIILVIVTHFYCPVTRTTIDAEEQFARSMYPAAKRRYEELVDLIGTEVRPFGSPPQECVLERVSAGHRRTGETPSGASDEGA